ncbi:MAG: TrkH family potassium uptake protein [Spirochaetaceae bacterium]|nr:TrkH family potassium uptake protein [Spirochaetaceae bacterium]
MYYIKLLRLPFAALVFIFPAAVFSFVVALIYGESRTYAVFAVSAVTAVLLSVPACFSIKRNPPKIHIRDGFFVVTFTWIFLAFFGAIPYFFQSEGFTFTDSVFESACAFATSGSTINNVEILPHALLFWRSISHWIGGMGIILLTVALLPLLGVGGFQLVKAESSGPEKEKITPKIRAAAKMLWCFYCMLTLFAFALYAAGGMNVFDALCHAFTTLATGGISTKNNGLAYYNSGYLNMICALFMLLAAVNFNLYYKIMRGNIREVIYNSELRGYIGIFIAASALITISAYPQYGSAGAAIHDAVFQVSSFLSTSGSVITDYSRWPPLAQAVLFLLMFTGGCSGSTAGGIKIIRHIVLYKQMANEMRRMIYPRGVFSIQLDHKVGRKDVVYGVAGFISLYISIVAITTLVTAGAGFDILTSLSAALAVLGNVGSGFGSIGPGCSYSIFPDYIKWFYIVVMIAGRLELWTMILLFRREYWRS